MKTVITIIIVMLVLLFLYQAGVFGKIRLFDFDLTRLPWVPKKPEWFPSMSTTWYGFFAIVVPIVVVVLIAWGLHRTIPIDVQPEWFVRIFFRKDY